MKNTNMTTIALGATFALITPICMAEPTDKAAEAKANADPNASVTAQANANENSAVAAKTEAEMKGTVAGVINDSVTFSILNKAIKAAGLTETLSGDDNYTVFAPTDEAFMKLDEETLAELMLPSNKEKLRSLLLYHVIPGTFMSADLRDDTEVTTANGEKVEVDVDDKEIKINDSEVFKADTSATNGVMHSIGEVLVPESLDGFVGLDD